ncbi:MAG: tRNA lysidine(34) synthetase TilS [Planctomycetes bacterium]|nr:tRNA lysidine(34) synthetase TilS [Planctomycetota bacterium]
MEPADSAASDAARSPFAPGRWSALLAPLGVAADEPVVLALSGGADSVYLLGVAAAARPRPRLCAVHVDHGLRGAESAGDAAFCAAECARLEVPFERIHAPLDPAPSGLEARAREARYAALAQAARAAGIGLIATAHHADDALETLILRWVRGAEFAGLAALRPRRELAPGGPNVVRPLLGLRRAQIRAELSGAGRAWREDSSNADPRFARNALRVELLPRIAAACGPDALENLFAFERAVADLEAALASRSGELRIAPPRFAAARRAARDARLGGSVARGELAALPRPLARRALARLLADVAGALPRRAALDALLDDLFGGRTGSRQVRGGWRVQLRGDRLDVEPPAPRAAGGRQLALPFAAGVDQGALAVPGACDLGDGRRITAARVERAPGSGFPLAAERVEIDARGLPEALTVRTPRRGDRFHPLGAAGSKPLARFLADCGVPRHDRARIPLVVAGDEIVWVAGVRPAHGVRVRSDTRARIELALVLDEEPRPRRAR